MFRPSSPSKVRDRIDFQSADKAGQARFGAFKLVVPFVGAGEQAMYYTDETHTTRARFDAPLRCHGWPVSPALDLKGERPRRIPGRHGRTGLHAGAESRRHRDGFAVALLRLRRHEPGRNPGARSLVGIPAFFRGTGDFDFCLNGTASKEASIFTLADCSLGWGFCGIGCATITRRCKRPPGADSSWYFETSFVTASVSSWLKAARSVADRKRTSVSTARVARRLPVSFARRTRPPTSRTTRAPRAMR